MCCSSVKGLNSQGLKVYNYIEEKCYYFDKEKEALSVRNCLAKIEQKKREKDRTLRS